MRRRDKDIETKWCQEKQRVVKSEMLSHHQKELSRERERDMLRDRDVRGKTSQENDVSKKMSPERFVARRRRQENERLFRS